LSIEYTAKKERAAAEIAKVAKVGKIGKDRQDRQDRHGGKGPAEIGKGRQRPARIGTDRPQAKTGRAAIDRAGPRTGRGSHSAGRAFTSSLLAR
jgi:hypothetical protein